MKEKILTIISLLLCSFVFLFFPNYYLGDEKYKLLIKFSEWLSYLFQASSLGFFIPLIIEKNRKKVYGFGLEMYLFRVCSGLTLQTNNIFNGDKYLLYQNLNLEKDYRAVEKALTYLIGFLNKSSFFVLFLDQKMLNNFTLLLNKEKEILEKFSTRFSGLITEDQIKHLTNLEISIDTWLETSDALSRNRIGVDKYIKINTCCFFSMFYEIEKLLKTSDEWNKYIKSKRRSLIKCYIYNIIVVFLCIYETFLLDFNILKRKLCNIT